MSRQNEIVQLTSLWYKIVSMDHHKDRDCHFYINVKYSYGDKPDFWVEHMGYIKHPDINECFATMELAEDFLLDTLCEMIQDKRDWATAVLAEKNPKIWDEYQKENAMKILELIADTVIKT